MSVEIKVPEMGESVFEATISNWIKGEGERVSAGEPVVELETDKVNLEVGAPKAGIIERIERQVGDNVVVGDVLAFIAPGEDQVEKPEKVEAAAPDKAESETAVEVEDTEETVIPQKETGTAGVKATPLAERMAQERSVDLSRVKPTGSGGRVTKEDVQAFLDNGQEEKQKAAPTVQEAAPSKPAVQEPTQAEGRETRKRMSRRRQTIARRLVEAQQTAAMLTTFNELTCRA
jgi:2-oxoglutarate dehydrogenase E2 component (dihydrolipoamide succinyltransferase)